MTDQDWIDVYGELPFDVALHKSQTGAHINVWALTLKGKDIVDEICPGIRWVERLAPDDLECLWVAQVEPATEIDWLAAEIFDRDGIVGLFSPDAKYCTPYVLKDDGSVSVHRAQ